MTQVTLKGKTVKISGVLPEVGSKAKTFRLVNQDLADKSLEDYQDKKKLLITVPSLDTSTCLKESKHLNDLAKQFSDVVFLVISADLPFAQKRICVAENMNNIQTLSMMRSKDFAKDYGILLVSGPLEGLCARSLILIDQKNMIVYTQLVPEITEEPNYDALRRIL